MIRAIVAVDKEWGIGKKNDLLFKLKEDMKFFRTATTGKVVVMGSNTLKSFPGGKPLPNRVNAVLWPGGVKRDDCIVADSMEELKSALEKYRDQDIFVIGGAMFYKTMLPYCEEALVTKVDASGGAEVFFPDLDKMPQWRCVFTSPCVKDGEYTINFTTYKNDSPTDFFAK